jgi:23S rRNA (adenine2503-C2)-methyltransferase
LVLPTAESREGFPYDHALKHPANHIFDHTLDSLREWAAARGMKPFRPAQVMEWVYRKNVADPAAMTNLSALDREVLAREMTFLSGRTVAHQQASDGVQKLLIEWSDLGPPADAGSSEKKGIGASRHQGTEVLPEHRDEPTGLASRLRVLGQPVLGVVEAPGGDTARQTECVMIPTDPGPAGPDEPPSPARRTACVSSQVGCPVGCRFCASGIGGLDGNLSAGRIVEQVWRLQQLEGVGRISNVVFMGMGEPLSNFAAVTKAIRTLASDWGPNISARKITISTVGLPKAIEKLAEQMELPVTLALSLHAPNDELRRQLIPWAEYTTIKDLLAACQKWFEKTGREITLEYTLLRGVNDKPEHAVQLAQLARTLRANINLIRYNEVAGMPFQRPRTEDVLEFQRLLRLRHVNTHIRRSRGRDIAAACGQLRHERATA